MGIKRIAMISYHTCPLASEEGKETGGMNVSVLELSKELARLGYTVDMYTRCQHPSNPEQVVIYPNLRLIHLKDGAEKPVLKKELINYIPEYIKSYLSFTKKYKLSYDILHCHYYLSGLIGLKINENSSNQLPIIMSFYTLALMKNLVARDELEKEEIRRINAEILLTEKSKKIIAPSDSEMQYLQYLYNTPKEKIIVIPPGVDVNHFKPLDKNEAKKKIGLEKEAKLILFVGRIEPLKGLDMLLYAIKVLVMKKPDLNICLWVVGGDVSQKPHLWSKQLKTLEQLRKALHISMVVHFVGQRSQKELPYYYNASEVVIMPSHYESFGLVALEAMACGIPVITTNVAGVSNLIDEKHRSLITTVNNPLLLASQIEFLLTNNIAHKEISKDIFRKAQDLSWSNIAKKTIEVYG